MELRQLRQFVAVAEHLHFARAAQALSMAQPPLSRAIRALEEELGARLFDRDRRRVALSDAGRALLPEAHALLAAAARLPATARDAAAGHSGDLALAFVSIVGYSFLPGLLRRHAARFPGVRVNLREVTTDVQVADLAAGRADVGILLGPVQAEAGGVRAAALDYRVLAVETLAVALPARHRLARGAGVLGLEACADEAFVASPRHVAPRLNDAIIGSCAAAGFSPRIVQEAIQMQTIISLVSAGMGVALVPESVVGLKRPGVAYRRLKGARPVLEIGMATRRGETSAVVANFVALAAQSRA